MKILFIGDTFGKSGRKIVTHILPSLRKEKQIDFVIMNAENLAGGISPSEKTIQEMEKVNVDFFTGGNHSFHDMKMYENPRENLLRPANVEDGVPGKGKKIISLQGKRLGIVNLLGRVFMKIPVTCPFRKMESILLDWKKEKLEGIFVDFHAETTSEKAAFYHHFKKNISAIIGTHTHIPTSDGRIDKDGTFFQTDIGMTGPVDSIIGLKIESGIENFLSATGKKKFQPETSGETVFRAILLDIQAGKTHNHEKIEIFE